MEINFKILFGFNDLYYKPIHKFIGNRDTFFQRLRKKIRDKRSYKNYIKNLRYVG